MRIPEATRSNLGHAGVSETLLDETLTAWPELDVDAVSQNLIHLRNRKRLTIVAIQSPWQLVALSNQDHLIEKCFFHTLPSTFSQKKQTSPLHYLAFSGKHDLIGTWKAKQPKLDLFAVSEDSLSIAMFAAAAGRVETVKALVAMDAKQKLLDLRGEMQLTLAHMLVENCHVEALKQFLKTYPQFAHRTADYGQRVAINKEVYYPIYDDSDNFLDDDQPVRKPIDWKSYTITVYEHQPTMLNWAEAAKNKNILSDQQICEVQQYLIDEYYQTVMSDWENNKIISQDAFLALKSDADKNLLNANMHYESCCAAIVTNCQENLRHIQQEYFCYVKALQYLAGQAFAPASLALARYTALWWGQGDKRYHQQSVEHFHQFIVYQQKKTTLTDTERAELKEIYQYLADYYRKNSNIFGRYSAEIIQYYYLAQNVDWLTRMPFTSNAHACLALVCAFLLSGDMKNLDTLSHHYHAELVKLVTNPLPSYLSMSNHAYLQLLVCALAHPIHINRSGKVNVSFEQVVNLTIAETIKNMQTEQNSTEHNDQNQMNAIKICLGTLIYTLEASNNQHFLTSNKSPHENLAHCLIFNVDLLLALCDERPDENYLCSKSASAGSTLLHIFIDKNNDYQQLKRLLVRLPKGVDLTQLKDDIYGDTLIHYLARRGDQNFILCLLEDYPELRTAKNGLWRNWEWIARNERDWPRSRIKINEINKALAKKDLPPSQMAPSARLFVPGGKTSTNAAPAPAPKTAPKEVDFQMVL